MAEGKINSCCLKGFKWDGTPTGRTEKLGSNDVYVAGTNAEVGVLLVHDLYGWTFGNLRLLADQVAREANVTVYMPDLFGGEVLSSDLISAGRFQELDLDGFTRRNGREAREPELFACARALRADRGHSRVGMFVSGGMVLAVLAGEGSTCRAGRFCSRNADEPLKPVTGILLWRVSENVNPSCVWHASSSSALCSDRCTYLNDSWAGLRLGAEEHKAAPLVDCISFGHPSLVTKKDFDEVAVPVQILAPERDPSFSPEMKLYAFETIMKKGVQFDYLHLPGVEHGCLVRGKQDEPGERETMVFGKNAVVAWLVAHLHKGADA